MILLQLFFELPCAVGTLGVPLRVAHSDCAQADPHQLTIVDVSCDPVDTASMSRHAL